MVESTIYKVRHMTGDPRPLPWCCLSSFGHSTAHVCWAPLDSAAHIVTPGVWHFYHFRIGFKKYLNGFTRQNSNKNVCMSFAN